MIFLIARNLGNFCNIPAIPAVASSAVVRAMPYKVSRNKYHVVLLPTTRI